MLFSPVWSLGGERFERNFLNLSIMPHSFSNIIGGNYRDFFQPRVVPRGKRFERHLLNLSIMPHSFLKIMGVNNAMLIHTPRCRKQ